MTPEPKDANLAPQWGLYRPAQVKSGEVEAAKLANVSMRSLMAAAGKAVFEYIDTKYRCGSRLAVFCGEGNNGGDGYVIARLAQQAGYAVTVLALKPNRKLPAKPTNDAEHARQAWREADNTEQAFEQFEAKQTDIIVDAVFGIGLDRPLDEDLQQWVARVNQCAAPTIAVDIPSGLNGDSGAVLGDCIQADTTITMVAHKRGLWTAKGRVYCGHIQLAELGINAYLARVETPVAWLSDAVDWHQHLPPRPADSHKGDNGHVLIVGANHGMPGSCALAMLAALRAGAGKVSVACHPSSAGVIAGNQPEAMVHSIADANELELLLQQASVVVLGPGLGQDDWASNVFAKTMATDKPLVLDADGLNLLATHDVAYDTSKTLITPHPGEASRLLQLSAAKIEQDRFAAVEKLQRHAANVLLKGAGSLVSTPDKTYVVAHGSPAMASGGMGDCLAGLIGALLAQGMAANIALPAAVHWHALAGEQAGKEGERGTIASDLLPWLRRYVNHLDID